MKKAATRMTKAMQTATAIVPTTKEEEAEPGEEAEHEEGADSSTQQRKDQIETSLKQEEKSKLERKEVIMIRGTKQIKRGNSNTLF